MKNQRNRIAIALAGVCLLSAYLQAKNPVNDPVRVDARLDRPVIYADQIGKVVVQIELRPEEIEAAGDRAPVNLGLVLDRSGSMRGKKIEQAIEAARLAVGQLGPRDIVSVVIYDDKIDTIAPAGEASREYRERIRAALKNVGARGNTAIYGGLTQAAAELRKFAKEGYINRLILLSDGLANTGPSAPSDFERLAHAFASEDFIVSTIGLGLDFNEDIMTTLAAAGQGNTYFVETATDLPRIFQRELGDVLSVAATDVQITIRSRDGIRVIRGIGREAEVEEGRVARVRMSQVYGGLDKLALIELEVPAGREGEQRELVDIEVSYRLAGTDVVQRQQIVVPVSFSSKKEEIAESVQEEVVMNVAENRLAESKAAAIAYADLGDPQQAAATLRDTADDLEREYDNFAVGASVRRVAQSIPADAAVIEKEGLSNRKRKEYRSESYQTVNQQTAEETAE